MRVGLLTDAFTHLSLPQTLAWCAEHGLDCVELGTGGYSGTPHADLAALSGSGRARADLLGQIASHGLALGALNVSGNPTGASAGGTTPICGPRWRWPRIWGSPGWWP